MTITIKENTTRYSTEDLRKLFEAVYTPLAGEELAVTVSTKKLPKAQGTFSYQQRNGNLYASSSSSRGNKVIKIVHPNDLPEGDLEKLARALPGDRRLLIGEPLTHLINAAGHLFTRFSGRSFNRPVDPQVRIFEKPEVRPVRRSLDEKAKEINDNMKRIEDLKAQAVGEMSHLQSKIVGYDERLGKAKATLEKLK